MGNRISGKVFFDTDDGLYIADAINNQITNEMYRIFPPIDTKKYMINAVLTTEPVETITKYYHHEYKHRNFVIYEIKKSTN